MAGNRYEWDEAKRVENLGKHGVDFEAIRRFDWSGFRKANRREQAAYAAAILARLARG